MKSHILALTGWVTYASQTVSLGTIPIGAYVFQATVHCTQGFNSDGTDNITIGRTGDTDAFVTNVDVTSAGFNTGTLGTLAGYQPVSYAVNAYYANSGTEPTQGKAFCTLHCLLAPVSP